MLGTNALARRRTIAAIQSFGRACSYAVLGIALGIASGCSDAPGGAILYAWLQMGPDGVRIARAITEDRICPDIEIDGHIRPMVVRAEPDPPAVPVLTCELTLPANATRAAIGGFELPMPPREANRLAVIGDTGCRIEDGHAIQPCNDPNAWPFASLATLVAEIVSWLEGEPRNVGLEDLAQSIAALDPDLIVHVGDYLYRADECPEGNAGCEGSPYGFNWATIEADYFAPAAPMFGKAALVLTRGNHESCDLAGPLWFRFLDSKPYDGTCVDFTEPFAVEVGGLRFLMLDSSAANDFAVDPSQVEIYRPQFEQLQRLAGPRSFVVTHRPIWGFENETGGLTPLNLTLQAALEDAFPASVNAVLSGHVHLFQLLSFDQPRTPQVMIGNSGTELAPAVTTPLSGLEIDGASVDTGETYAEFGFATLEADAAGWRLKARSLDGTVLRDCALSGYEASC